MNKQQLKEYVCKQLNCTENDLIWSEQCRNPLTNYHHEDGTIKGKEGYYILSETYIKNKKYLQSG